jgi:hypothetical protein
VVIQTEEALKVLEDLAAVDLLAYIITELYTLLLVVVVAALTTATMIILAAAAAVVEQMAATVVTVAQKMA